MRAAFYSEQGPAENVFTVGERPTPEPGQGEVRVRLKASGINPSDWKVRKGGFGRGLVAPIVIPHSDGAGVIDAIGTGVDAARIGERVWIWNGQWQRASGTAAEFICVPSVQAVRLPDRVGFDEGACLGIPASTALYAVRAAAGAPNATVLITGGAGAVGSCAIQLAKKRGFRVITTVSSKTKGDFAREMGADEIVNYVTEDVAARVRELTNGEGVGSIIEVDLTSNARHYPAILRPHGTVAVYGMAAAESTLPALWMMQNSITVRFLFVYTMKQDEREIELAELTQALENGELDIRIAHRFSLDDVARAHNAVERGGFIGNVILEI